MNDFIGPHELYPLKFSPIYQPRIWGGDLLSKVLSRELPDSEEKIGESWEIVDRDRQQSVVANGMLAGITLGERVKHYQKSLLGPKVPAGKKFPLLVKLLDAGERLSLQVHPNETAALMLGGGAEPKTEMWYILAAEKDARIFGGLTGRATKLQLRESLEKPEVENLLQIYDSKPGDAYFIPAGTLHAIGGGNLILEIQQNSDTTYRLSDWGRTCGDGQFRELQVDKGMQAIDFMNRTPSRISGISGTAGHNRKYPIVRMCRHFQIDELHLADIWHDSTNSSNSFHLLSAIDNPFSVGVRDGESTVEVRLGETVLIPFAAGDYTITPPHGGETKVIKTTL